MVSIFQRVKAVKQVAFDKLDAIYHAQKVLLTLVRALRRSLKSGDERTKNHFIQVKRSLADLQLQQTTAHQSLDAILQLLQKQHDYLASQHESNVASQLPASTKVSAEGVNDGFMIIPLSVFEQPIYGKLAVSKLLRKWPVQKAVLLGDEKTVEFLKAPLLAQGCAVQTIEWQWGSPVQLDGETDGCYIVVCLVPNTLEHWQGIRALKQQYESRVICLHELVLPFKNIELAKNFLDYHFAHLDTIDSYYLSEACYGPIDTLNTLYSLAGKTVIEFGPLDGYQTSNLLNFGVKNLTAIEARAENFIKVLIASHAFDWHNLKLVMDDLSGAENC